MGSFLGASFGFGASDRGFAAAIGSATKSLDDINGLLDEQDKKGSGLGKMWKGMGEKVKQFNIASIAGSMRDLTGETGSLSNGLESMAVGFAQSTKPIIASMNLTAKEAQKLNSRAVGMAIGLNTSADAVAETLKAIHSASAPAKSAIDAMALSEKEWVKVVQTTGVTMQDYQAVLGNMVASWGASPDSAADMINSLMAIGKAAGTGTVGIKTMKGQMDAIDTIFEKLPPSASRSADEIASLMKSTVALSGAFKDLGETEEKSMDLAQSTGSMFAEQAVAIKRAQLGLGSYEDSPLYKWMTMLGVSSDAAISIIDEGSRDAVAGAKRIQSAMAEGIASGSIQADAAMAGLNEAMGSSAGGLAYLVGNLDQGAAALDRVSSLTYKSKDALKKYGDQAYSSGRTLQDSFDLARDSFDTKIRSISRKGVKNFVKDQMSAYRSVGKELKILGSDETWGPLIQHISAFKQSGARGVFVTLGKQLGLTGKEASKLGVKFEFALGIVEDLGKELGPLMSILGQFGPLGFAVGGIAGFFMLAASQRKKIMDKINPLFEKIKKFWKEKFIPAAKDAWKSIGDWFKNNWHAIWEETVKPGIKWFVSWFKENIPALKSALVSAFDEIWDEFGIGGVAAAAGVLGTIAAGIPGVGGILETTVSGMGNVLGSAIGGGVKLGLESLPWGLLFTRGGIIGMAIVGGLAWLGKALHDDIQDAVKKEQEAKSIAKGAASGAAHRQARAVENVWGQLGDVRDPKERQAQFNEMVRSGIVDPSDFNRKGATADMSGVFDKVWGVRESARETSTSGAFDRIWGVRESERAAAMVDTTGQIRMTSMALLDKKEVNKALENVRRLSVLPDVQRQLSEAADASGTELWNIISGINQVYSELSPEKLDQLMMQANELVNMSARAAESGIIGPQMSDMADAMIPAGQTIMGEFGYGLSSPESMSAVTDGATAVTTKAKHFFGGSLPEEGPLAGGHAQNPVYFGGQSLMQEFSDGIWSGKEVVTTTINDVLEESIMGSLETYKVKVEEWSKKKSLLKSVARQMVEDFGGELTLGSVEVEGSTLDSKQTFETALNLPGLAGVIAAIASDGHKTRVLLKKIWEDTNSIANSNLVQGGEAPGGATLPS